MSTPQTLPPAASGAGWLAPAAALSRFIPQERLAGTGVIAQKEQVRFGFRVGDLGLLVPANTGTEVVPLTAFASIPRSAPWLRGVYNLRGNLVPVIDLAVRLGMDRQRPPIDASQNQATKPHVLIFGKGGRAVGITIDGFPRGLTGLRPVGQIPDQQGLLELHVSAALTTGGDVWFEFDPERLFQGLAEH
ncbi:MAG: chemotaxis protein CheW [Burkholderiales bacterium]